MATHRVYRLYAELEDYKPKIWRRFEVNGNKTIAELGYALMTMFEMQASHLFCFTYEYGAWAFNRLQSSYSEEALEQLKSEGRLLNAQEIWRFELPDEDMYELENDTWFDASKSLIKNVFNNDAPDITFKYDYGDNWCVKLRFEGCEKMEIDARELPRVLEGEGFGILENCGGVPGLEALAKTFKKKKGRQYDAYCQWLGIDNLDLSSFDIDDINFRLKKLPRVYKEIYEYEYEPTQRSIDIIERKYMK